MSNQSHYHHNQPGQFTPPPAPLPPKKKMPLAGKLAIWFLAVPALMIGATIAVVAGTGLANQAAQNADKTPVPGAQSTYDPGINTPQPKKPAEQAPTLLPTDGTLLVGKDVKPGTYQTRVPDAVVPSCYWARLKDIDGGLDSIIANDLKTTPGALVTLRIRSSDYAVEINCDGQAWTRVGA